MYKPCKAIGRIEKTYGKAGEVVAVGACDLSFILQSEQEVYIVPPALEIPRGLSACVVSSKGEGAILRFKGIKDLNQASLLVGKTILMRISDLNEAFYLNNPTSLLGVPVVDRLVGFLGTIEEILQGPVQNVWSLNGPYGSILIPYVEDELNAHYSDEGITLTIPNGMSDVVDTLR